MRKVLKSILTTALVAALCVTTVVPASAATNNNTSVDPGTSSAGIYTLPKKNAELTIGQGGQYQLQLELSKKAQDFGFFVGTDGGLRLRTRTSDGTLVNQRINVTWSAQKSYFADITSGGKVLAKNVCKTYYNSVGEKVYYTAAVTASIPNQVYKNADGDQLRFTDGMIYKNRVTVVPERDLLVYYLGVWEEDDVDNDALHIRDWDLDSANVKTMLRDMAQNVTQHCYSKDFSVLALTKTNDGVVRAYLQTKDTKAGNHFYIMKFETTNNGENTVTVRSRDYCDDSYETTGTYTRQ